MAQWNSNPYYGNYQPNSNDGGHPDTGWQNSQQYYQQQPHVYNVPQQYVGFNDFLNQFQHTSSYQNQNYAPNLYSEQNQNSSQGYEARNTEYVNYNQTPVPSYHQNLPSTAQVMPNKAFNKNVNSLNNTQQVPYVDNSNQAADVNGHQENKENNESVAQPKNNRQQNKRYQKKEQRIDKYRARQSLPHNAQVFTSNLTPTALEFVPQSAQTENHDPRLKEYTEVDTRHSVEEPNSSTSGNSRERYQTESPARSDKWKSKKQTRDNRNTDWRKRDDEPTEEQPAQASSSEQASFTVYNSNRPQVDEDIGYKNETDGARNSKIKNSQNTKPKYSNNERNYNHNDRQQRYRADNQYCNSNYNQDGESQKGRNKLPYNSDERYNNSDNNGRNQEGASYSGRNKQSYTDDRFSSEHNKSQDDAYRGRNRSSYAAEDKYSNPDYNRPQEDNYRSRNKAYNQDDRYNSSNYSNKNQEGDSRGRNKASYSMNETFSQRNSRRGDYNEPETVEYDEYNAEVYSQGAMRKYKTGNTNSKNTKMSAEKKDIDGTEVTQRERLTEQLNRGILECLVCCERVRQLDTVWSCTNCFHVLHLKCLMKWASSSKVDGEWRCPACQNKSREVPSQYRCFCGKRRNPEWNRTDAAHTCGDTCGKQVSCVTHACTILCHAGPCPQCEATVEKHCECGASSQRMRCCTTQPLLCGGECGRALNCQLHHCKDVCHAGPCQPCVEIVNQQCYCPKEEKRSLLCDAETVGVVNYACGDTCNRLLACGNHRCLRLCHAGACDQCPLMPHLVTKCPCGQTLLTAEQQRKSCLDEVPVCSKVCSKVLTCGPADTKHICKTNCHHEDCPPCPDKTQVSCRCTHITKNIPCVDLEKERDNVRCGKKCTKKQSCGRHRCKTLCCVDAEHRCPLPCTRTLSCGLHRCADTCHSGHCDPCWRISFEELRCACGAAVRYPPVECGARPPACTQPCTLGRACGHPPLHQCHPATQPCPPCTVLTQRYCHGRHKMRKTIPCHQEDFSCGLPCGKDLPCGKHKCIETCHKGECPQGCKQACAVERPGCGHPCAGPCGHAPPCPLRTACRHSVNAVCPCGRRAAPRSCHDNARDLNKLLSAGASALLGAMGEPVDISALIAKGNNTTTLECDEECQLQERNRRLAIGLQIRNPDLSAKLTPRYSEFMKTMAARDEGFCNKVHDHLTQLVLLAQKSKQKSRSHSFQPMNRQKRQFVHEMCEHFGCESQAYDQEPYRNIVATAFREKSWLPALSLLEVIRRDKGQRRVPGPMISVNTPAAAKPTTSSSSSGSAWATLGSSLSSSSSLSSAGAWETVQPHRKPKIDYFDTPPED